MVDGTPSSPQQTIDGVRICNIVALLIFHGMHWGRVSIGNVLVSLFVVRGIEHLFLTLLPSILPFVIIELGMKLQKMSFQAQAK